MIPKNINFLLSLGFSLHCSLAITLFWVKTNGVKCQVSSKYNWELRAWNRFQFQPSLICLCNFQKPLYLHTEIYTDKFHTIFFVRCPREIYPSQK